VDAACAREGWSHAVFAARANVTPQGLSRALRPDGYPSAPVLARILAACGVRLEAVPVP
jgi:DNA-binding phage protein